MNVRRSIPLRPEIMEERVLLSSGIADPAAAVQIEAKKAPKSFTFNGKLELIFTATDSGVAPGFRERKPFPPMGEKVSVTGGLADTGIDSPDGLPNLGGSTFELSNAKGSLLVTFSSSTTNAYDFTISGGTKHFVRADGTAGTALLARSSRMAFRLTFKTNPHAGQPSNPAPGGNLTTLASFAGLPSGAALDPQGNLYWTTESGGTNGLGAVYEIAKGSGTLVTVASFNGTNGALPSGVTIDAHGNLYATTQAGGPAGLGDGMGTVWEIARGTDTITTLAAFNVPNGSGRAVEPRGGVTLDAQGDLYGTTETGGPDSVGTVWELARGSNTLSTVASFDGANGSLPSGGVILDAQGNLYGATATGGPYNSGTIWEIATGSNTITTLLGVGYEVSAVDSQGNFYVAASNELHEPSVEEFSRLANGTYGGSKVVFFKGIHSLERPSAVTVDAQGNLYGTIAAGGAYGDGILWEIVKGSNTITTLASFGGTNGSTPVSGVTLDGAGNLYGTTYTTGPNGLGTVWEFTPALSRVLAPRANCQQGLLRARVRREHAHARQWCPAAMEWLPQPRTNHGLQANRPRRPITTGMPLPREDFMRSPHVRWMLSFGIALLTLTGVAGRSHAGSLIFVSNFGGTIQEFTSSGTEVGTISPGLGQLHGLAFDASGNLYVASQSGVVEKFSPSGANLGTFASGLNIADGLAFDRSGNLYVVENGSNLVEKFSPTGADLGAFASTGLSGPTGLAFDAAGNLYVANYASGTIEKFSPTGADLGTFASGLNGPQGLAFDKAGNLYVTNGQFSVSGGSVEEFSSAGVSLGTFATTNLSGPVALAFDSAGNLYVANFSGDTIQEFSSTGSYLGGFATAAGPSGVAIQVGGASVPEPSSLVLGLMGLGLLGGYAASRQRRARGAPRAAIGEMTPSKR